VVIWKCRAIAPGATARRTRRLGRDSDAASREKIHQFNFIVLATSYVFAQTQRMETVIVNWHAAPLPKSLQRRIMTIQRWCGFGIGGG
jgi:hypothetical protein